APERRAYPCRFAVEVHAETAAVGAHVREIEVVSRAKAFPLRLGQDFVDVTLELGLAEIAKLDRHQVAVESQHRRNADREVHVGASLSQTELEEGVDARHAGRLSAACCRRWRARCAAPPSTRSA